MAPETEGLAALWKSAIEEVIEWLSLMQWQPPGSDMFTQP
jgi:hypothetical protein